MKICLIIFLVSCQWLSFVAFSQQQPDHDIVVFDLEITSSSYAINNPVVVANSTDYENQPHFSPDGSTLWFTKMQNGLTNIWQWNEAKSQTLHETSLSEFSPTPIPFKPASLSIIRVEKDGRQRLWEVDSKGNFSLIFNQVQPVGYHAWKGKDVAMFILGEPNSLQISSYGSAVATIVDDNIGRCLAPIPGKQAISYTKHTDKVGHLMTYDFALSQSKRLINMPDSAQDYAWIDSNTVISSTNSELVVANLSQQPKWQKVVNRSNMTLKGISRVAYSASTNKLAIVVEK